MQIVCEIADNSGTSVLAVCRTLIKLMERGLVRPHDGDVEGATKDLRQRIQIELRK